MQKNVYTINLRDQQSEVADYRWAVDDEFFAALEGALIQRGTVDVDLQVERLAGGQYDLHFRLEGEVTVPCDRCMEPMSQHVEGSATLRARLGDEDSDDGEVVVIPEERGTLDLQWLLYEQTALLLPLRNVHPEGQCPGDAESTLARYAASGEEPSDDPRWDALKGILDKQ